MYGVLHHLARRGFEPTQENYNGFEIKSVEDQPDEQIRRFPFWGIAIVWSTFMLFLFVQFAVSEVISVNSLPPTNSLLDPLHVGVHHSHSYCHRDTVCNRFHC